MEYYLGIDLGGTNIKAGVVDDAFHIIGRAKAKTGIPRPAEEVMDAMAQCAKAAAADAGVPWEKIRRIGIGVPGTANEETGVVEYANNLLFENVPMRAYLQKKLNKEIDITNDANALAGDMAETSYVPLLSGQPGYILPYTLLGYRHYVFHFSRSRTRRDRISRKHIAHAIIHSLFLYHGRFCLCR